MSSEPEQQYIPGLEPEKNEAVHAAAVEYARLDRNRKHVTAEAKGAHEYLIRMMEIEGLDSYEYGDVLVRINKTSKAKAVVARADDEDGA